ncbi:MBL fold metallo-hydrolase [Pseudohalioglobus sediminis]|uniref:MBL fold metallo-hydrolase n=1 Tax=Pseudohalioglobus sediminis TaxID=2606449 RepID=A0A5B0WTH5_9GAMM|nr:MBL fold metallo-hydrolase [Pseudohalioglobus sediminis]KAA1189595.1 MBL fold metallo-hydrolase [Pseudohalioglobus sediminis]
MIFRQLFDSESSTYTYILGCPRTREAIVIDSVFEQHARDAALLRELDLQVRYALDTHVHADHVTGAWLLRQHLGARSVLSCQAGVEDVDVIVDQGDELAFGDLRVEVRATPGHTDGCLTFVTGDRDMAFTGDCLLIRGAGRTDFQAGDAHLLWRSIREQIFTLPDDCLIYPGHDYDGRTVSTVLEEKTFNPRIGGEAREEDFVGYMQNMNLPHPRLIDIAVPANLKGGKPDDDQASAEADWGPVTVSFAGIPEIQPEWVARNRDAVLLLDVRSEGEYAGELGHLQDALLIPLDQLRERLQEVPRERPVVTVCQSGKRSAMAAQILIKAGVDRAANLAGGMIQWDRLGLPVAAG